MNQEIHCNLRVLMAHKKVNQKELANATELSRPTISKLYNDDFQQIDKKTLLALCVYFQCKVGDLIELIDSNA
jgi:putative transcriptional regulator